ncbi:MAG: beta-ketoacyl-[acyl-carrier-protein] synthase family protein [Pirellula sp.]
MASASTSQSVNDGNEDDIVITGLGTIAPTGKNVDEHLQFLLSGQSSVRKFTQIHGSSEYHWLSASIEGFDPKEHIQPRKSIKVMCREIQLAFAASMQACKQSGVSAGSIDPDRIGTVFSGELIQSDLSDVDDIIRRCATDGEMRHAEWAFQSMEIMYTIWMLKSLPNMAACHVGIALDARGPNNTITTEGTSSLNAVMEAINVIRRDKADVIVVGASGSRIGFLRLIQRNEPDFSKAIADESRACKPFDSQRDGTVPSEMSSAIVLERRSHALARGATPLATIVAWASTFAQPNRTRWSGVSEATKNAIDLLIQRSQIAADRIDHINACALGTRDGDLAESTGIAQILPKTPVVAYKGAIGDAGSATGLLEYISSIAAMRSGSIAPTTNCETVDAACSINVVTGGPKPRSSDSFIKLSNTPDGRCAGLLTRVD